MPSSFIYLPSFVAVAQRLR